MANSAFWMQYAGVVKIAALLSELVTSKDLDLVTLDPKDERITPGLRAALIYLGDDSHAIVGTAGKTDDLSTSVLVRVYGSQNAERGVVLELAWLLATVRDKIKGAFADFFDLDPPMQLDSLSLIEDPAFSAERDLSAATIEVRFRNH